MNPISSLLQLALTVYSLIMVARVLMSWIPLDTSNPTIAQVVSFIYNATEPVLRPIRNALPPMPIDLSPLIVFLILSVLGRLV